MLYDTDSFVCLLSCTSEGFPCFRSAARCSSRLDRFSGYHSVVNLLGGLSHLSGISLIPGLDISEVKKKENSDFVQIVFRKFVESNRKSKDMFTRVRCQGFHVLSGEFGRLRYGGTLPDILIRNTPIFRDRDRPP